jgi:hypothetical protein
LVFSAFKTRATGRPGQATRTRELAIEENELLSRRAAKRRPNPRKGVLNGLKTPSEDWLPRR